MCGIDPLYYLDEMSQDEAQAISIARREADKVSWEQTRLQAYYAIIAQIGTKEIKKPSDLFTFPWDDVKELPKGKRLSKEEFIKQTSQLLK